MSAADKICALQNVRRFKLVSEDGWHGMTVRPDGGYVSHKDYAALADLADALAQENANLTAENADLKTSVIAFCGVHAVTYAKQFGLPDGHLHPTHYDILEKAGARMDDFTRAALGETP